MSLTAEQSATVVGQLQWSSAAIASVAGSGDDPRLAAIAALLGHQATRWANHLPDSVLLRPADRVMPASALTSDAIAALGAVSPDGLEGAIAHLIRQLEGELEGLEERVGNVADAALARAIAETRTELRHASTRLHTGLASESTAAPVAELVRQIERGCFIVVADAAEG